jgi:tetratricopeptide (TPR) repeat protein
MIGRYSGRRRDAGASKKIQEPQLTRRALPAPESPVFARYQEFLEKKNIPAKEFDTRVREFTEHYREMRQTLRDLMPGDKSLDPSVEEIRDSLDQGDFDHVHGLLTEIGKRENADGVEKYRSSQKHLMAAAIAKSVAGDLQMARLEFADAANLYREAVEALPDYQEDMHGEYLNKYGTASYQAGDHEVAIDAFERSLKILERKLGKNHPDVATALNNLALLYYSRGNYDAAEPLYQRSLAIDEHTLGIDHPGVATDLNNLALLYKKQGNLEAAEPLLKRAMEIKEKQFDPGHPSLVTGLKNYASLLRALGRDEEAEMFERKASVLPPKRTASSPD